MEPVHGISFGRITPLDLDCIFAPQKKWNYSEQLGEVKRVLDLGKV